MLLRLLQDEEPLPDVFDAAVDFLRTCEEPSKERILAFMFRLLHLLGHLPEGGNADYFAHLSAEENNFIERARRGGDTPSLPSRTTLQTLGAALLSEQISGPLRAGEVAVSLL